MDHSTRRSVLVGLLGLATGCIQDGGASDSSREGQAPPSALETNEIIDVSLHVTERKDFDEVAPPNVTFDSERVRVIVTGWMVDGVCEKLVPERVAYDQMSDTLAVEVARQDHTPHKESISCSTVLRGSYYRLEVAFSDHLPKTVDASEKRSEHAEPMPPQRTIARREPGESTASPSVKRRLHRTLR